VGKELTNRSGITRKMATGEQTTGPGFALGGAKLWDFSPGPRRPDRQIALRQRLNSCPEGRKPSAAKFSRLLG